jgi:O-antigen ligase
MKGAPVALVPVAVFIAALLKTDHWPSLGLAILGLSAAIIIVQKQWHSWAFQAAAFFIPLSAKVSLGTMDIMFPGEWIIGVLFLVVLFETVSGGKIKLRWFDGIPALWVLSFVLPTLFSDMPLVSSKFTALNAIYVVAFYFGARLFGNQDIHLWLRNYFISFLLVVLWGAYQFYQFDFNPITIIGVFKPFYYSSTYVGAVAALFTGYFLGKGPRVGASLMLVLLATGIVIFTESRAALLSLLLLLFTWGLMQLSRPLRLVLPAAGVVVFLSFGGLEKLQTSFRYNKVESHDPNSNVFEETLSVTNVETDVSNKERLNRWVSALKMFSVQPHFGFGPGTYQFQYIPFQEASLKNRLSVRNPDDIPQGSGGTAHSELLLQLSENGWPSVVVFIAMLVFWVRRGIWQVGLSKNVAPYFLGLSTYLFHMNVNNFLNQPGFAFLFWTFGAMLMQGGDE